MKKKKKKKVEHIVKGVWIFGQGDAKTLNYLDSNKLGFCCQILRTHTYSLVMLF